MAYVLVDRGIATAAEFGVYGPEGAWLIEGHGVEPECIDAEIEKLQRRLRPLERSKAPFDEVPKLPKVRKGSTAPMQPWTDARADVRIRTTSMVRLLITRPIGGFLTSAAVAAS